MAAQWFCRVRGQMRGPLSSQELKALATSGQLEPDSLVRQGAAGAWVKAARVKGLFSAVAGTDAKASASRPSSDWESADVSNEAALPTLNTLGNLGDLPSAPNLASNTLPRGQAVATGLPVGDLPPVGTAIPAGIPVGGVVLPGAGTLSSQLTTSGAYDAARRKSAEKKGMSHGRIAGTAIIGMVLSFIGLCLVFKPLFPVVLGVAGALIGIRMMVIARRGHTAAKVCSVTAVLLGLGAAGFGLKPSIEGGSALVAQISSTEWRTGQPARRQSHSHPALQWHEAPDEVAQITDLQIQVAAARIGELPEGLRKDEHFLLVKIRVRNVSDRKVEYASPTPQLAELAPLLQDEKGSRYDSFRIRGLSEQVRKTSLYPDDVIHDLLVFQHPVPKFQYLELTLPGSSFGDTEPVRFKIPRSMVEDDTGKGAAEPEAAPTVRPKVVEIRSEGEDQEPIDAPPEGAATPEEAPQEAAPKQAESE